jgi:hypothetical protein
MVDSSSQNMLLSFFNRSLLLVNTKSVYSYFGNAEVIKKNI